jgi:hypothetical protein
MTTLNRRKLSKDDIEKLRKADARVVKGRFRCFEPMGGEMSFSFKKWPGEQVQHYTLNDGQIYDLPLAVAKHLNQNCAWDEHSNVLDAEGKPIKVVGKRHKRCSFESLEFAEIAESEE